MCELANRNSIDLVVEDQDKPYHCTNQSNRCHSSQPIRGLGGGGHCELPERLSAEWLKGSRWSNSFKELWCLRWSFASTVPNCLGGSSPSEVNDNPLKWVVWVGKEVPGAGSLRSIKSTESWSSSATFAADVLGVAVASTCNQNNNIFLITTTAGPTPTIVN